MINQLCAPARRALWLTGSLALVTLLAQLGASHQRRQLCPGN